MSRDDSPLVAIGVGNVLLGDDAAGVRVIEGLRDRARRDRGALPVGTRLVDGGTGGLDLLGALAEARGLVLVDATRLGVPAGTVSLLDAGEIDAPCGEGPTADATAGPGPTAAGSLRTPVAELVGAARAMGWLPPSAVLVGVEAGDTTPGLGLTEPVAAAIPAAMEVVLGQLRRMAGEGSADAADGGSRGMRGRLAGMTA